MSKRKWRRGPHILSLDELVRQEVVYWWGKPTARGWFLSWQFRMAAHAVGKRGSVFYALPAENPPRFRFSDEDIISAEHRLHTAPTLEGRKRLLRLLKMYDAGYGDVDDAIDRYEDDPCY